MATELQRSRSDRIDAPVSKKHGERDERNERRARLAESVPHVDVGQDFDREVVLDLADDLDKGLSEVRVLQAKHSVRRQERGSEDALGNLTLFKWSSTWRRSDS